LKTIFWRNLEIS